MIRPPKDVLWAHIASWSWMGTKATTRQNSRCTAKRTTSLPFVCMLPHSSHKLQPLNVGCFGPLKKAYGSAIEDLMRAHITHVSKEDFLAFHKAFCAAITEQSTRGGFRGAGLVSLDADCVISQLDMKLRTPTPSGISSGSPPVWESKTSNNPIEATFSSRICEKIIACH